MTQPCIYDRTPHFVHFANKFTGKERDSESNLDYFGSRFFSAALGRFLTVDPKILSRRKLLDPQGWDSYSYAQNNPTILLDPDGKEAILYLLNTAKYSPTQASAIAQQVGNKIHDAGVKNVKVIVTSDKSVTKFEGQHTVVGELVHGDVGAIGDAGGASGSHAALSHQFVVNVDKSNPDPSPNGSRSAVDRETTAVSNVATHEFTHEATSNSNVMGVFVKGFHDDDGLFAAEMHPDVLYDPKSSIPSDREFDLQDQFNRDNEKDNGVSVEVQPSQQTESDSSP